MCVTPPESKRFLRRPASGNAAIYFFVLSCLAAVVAYYGIFTGFSKYDDEGSMMIDVKEYLTGFKLYDQIPSLYGPVCFFYNWFIKLISGTNVDHDATRMTSAAVWLLCTLIFAWVVFRLTKSVSVASAAYVLIFRQLAVFRNEPGLPPELCTLLLVGLVASGLLVANASTQHNRNDPGGSDTRRAIAYQDKHRHFRDSRRCACSLVRVSDDDFLAGRQNRGRGVGPGPAVGAHEGSPR